MLLLDTYVLSALIAPTLPLPVQAWIGRQRRESLVTAAICQAEILTGLSVMPDGSRRLALKEAAQQMFGQEFDGRVLPFDSFAATAYAQLFAQPLRTGAAGSRDGFDDRAATAFANGADTVTRNVRHFNLSGVSAIDPWVE